MKTNNQINCEFRINAKSLYFITLSVVVILAVAGFLQLSSFNEVSAQKIYVTRATPEMIAYALTYEVDDIATRFNIINQLPCTDLDSSELGGRSLSAGVYCLSAARLAGELTLDGAGDAGAVFIFKVKGALTTEAGSRIALAHDAQAANIHFVAESAVIGANSNFRGNILTDKVLKVGDGASVKGALTSISNEVQAREADAPEGAGTGTLEICKAIDASAGNDISNRIFSFTVTGAISVGTAANPVLVPVGSCSAPFEVLAGTQTITEGNTGTFTNQTGAFTGGFQLNRVETVSSNSSSTLGVVNLSTRTAVVNIVDDTAQQKLTVRFVNQAAVTGFVEICKRAATIPITGAPADPGVTGFFSFTIEGVFTNSSNPNVRNLQQFVVPVGQCTNPIAVTISNPAPTGIPRESTVRVTELGVGSSVFLESVNTIPVDRLISVTLNQGVNSVGNTFSNPGGGFAAVRVIEGATSFNETLITFVNRSAPGVVKICKIAGPGIAIGTPFNFSVTGTTQTGTLPNTFVVVTRTVVVTAGSAATIGNCAFVPNADGTANQGFVGGTPVTIDEISPTIIPGVTGTVRTSRVTSSTNQGSANITPNANRISTATVTVRGEVIVVGFTNFVFNPTFLKICKIAGSAGLLNTPFTFDVALVSPLDGNGFPLLPAQTATATVTAGPAANGGNCVTVDNTAGFLGGAINAGSTVTVTERASTPFNVVTAIASPTSPTSTTNGFSANLTTRVGTFTGVNGLSAANTINIVRFTNTTIIGDPGSVSPFDFDGDSKANVSTFSPSNGNWSILNSNSGVTTTQFGQVGDKPVPRDYDGDGKYDIAVFRSGLWFILQSRDGFKAVQFGQAGDIPQPGDFDGDGRADVAVFRPSNGIWYILGSRDGFIGIQFGSTGDRPLVGDYDGDGKADEAVFRPSTGGWYINRSSAGFIGIQFGISTDRPVPADYDGDRRMDIAVYRDGTWFIQGSNTGFSVVQFGNATDRPVPADYNGDGKADIAVYRDGTWYMGSSSVQFGTADDTPIPSVYLY